MRRRRVSAKRILGQRAEVDEQRARRREVR